MKAVAINPQNPHSVQMVDLPMPSIDSVADGRGVLVKILQVGVDATDKELILGEYGNAPPGYDFLVLGHESFGKVVEVGPNVTEFAPGDYVTATVRRPGGSIFDQIGDYDMTAEDTYYEHGINLLHGYLTEFYVEHPDYLVKVPAALKDVGVLMEPVSVVEKGIFQALEIQRRLKVWQPRKAAVMGAGPIGLLAALILRLRGCDVSVFARTPKPLHAASLAEEIGARYISTREQSVADATKEFGPFDLILEATGSSAVVFESMHALAKNGVLVLTSVTGGDKRLEVEGDRLNLDFVLGNKVMVGTVNAHRGYFEMGVATFAQAELSYPGWLSKLLTHPVDGLENYKELFRILFDEKGVTKTYVTVAQD